MKKNMLLYALTLSSTLFAQEQESFCSGPKSPCIEKNIREIPRDGFFHMMSGEQKHLIVKFSKGDTFPIALNIGGSLVKLEKKHNCPYRLVFKRDIYICIPEENHILFSTDKKRWQPFMEFITGNLSVFTNFDEQTEELTAEISLHADKR